MPLRPVKLGQDLVGQPLPWDVCDEHGTLLMARGAVIPDDEHLERLLERHPMVHADFVWDEGAGPASPPDRLDRMQQKLEAVLPRPLLTPGSPEIILQQARDIREICADDLDAALGWAQLNRCGRHAVRHSMRVALVCEAVVRSLDLPDADHDALLSAALTMNVAMLDLQDSLVFRGADLTAEMREQIRSHPHRGAAILHACGIDNQIWLEAVRQHHEKLDGKGYPGGLAGPEIRFHAKLIKVADIYSARLMNPYFRFPRNPHTAMRDIFRREFRDVDAMLATALLRQIGTYHPGMMARLANHEIGVVVRRGHYRRPPLVMSVVGPRGEQLAEPRERDVGKRPFAIVGYARWEDARPRIDCNRLWGYAPPPADTPVTN